VYYGIMVLGYISVLGYIIVLLYSCASGY